MVSYEMHSDGNGYICFLKKDGKGTACIRAPRSRIMRIWLDFQQKDLGDGLPSAFARHQFARRRQETERDQN